MHFYFELNKGYVSVLKQNMGFFSQRVLCNSQNFKIKVVFTKKGREDEISKNKTVTCHCQPPTIILLSFSPTCWQQPSLQILAPRLSPVDLVPKPPSRHVFEFQRNMRLQVSLAHPRAP